MTPAAKGLACPQPECKTDCTLADPSSFSQHTRMFYTLSENLLHSILQGPLVGVRTVWLWKSKKQLMLPERYLKRRKWHIGLLLNMVSLRTIQEAKPEVNVRHAIAKMFCFVPECSLI